MAHFAALRELPLFEELESADGMDGPAPPDAITSAEVSWSPRPPARRRPPVSIVDARLDALQSHAVALPPGRTLLVLGEAGYGKTTVLLRRIALVARGFERGAKIAVIAPSSGLASSLQQDLRRLGVDVMVTTYDEWASAQARRSFRRVPREAEEASPAVARLKRARELRIAIERLGGTLPWNDPLVMERLGGPRRVTKADLELLFGDRVLLEEAFAERTDIAARVIDETLERTHLQHQRTTERAWASVTDKRRLRAVDGRPIDEGTPLGLAATVDVEDYAVLFELDRERSRRLGLPRANLRRFDLMAIDEAQEFAPLELSLLGESLAEGGTLIVAGDADQQMDLANGFTGWPSVMSELGRPDYERVALGIGYRCPAPVTEVARHVLGRHGPSSNAGDGPPCLYERFGSLRLCADTLGRAIASLREDDDRASVLVACRSPRTAISVHAIIKRLVPARLSLDGRFLKQGGVFVTTVASVKGLEFDYVAIPDATKEVYPTDAASRRELYVAITRARHQVLFCTSGPGTPLLSWPE